MAFFGRRGNWTPQSEWNISEGRRDIKILLSHEKPQAAPPLRWNFRNPTKITNNDVTKVRMNDIACLQIVWEYHSQLKHECANKDHLR